MGLAAAGLYYGHSKTRVRTDNAYVHATIYPVSARIPGTVLEVLVKDNQVVERDQLLVRLDPEDPSLKVRMAKAALASARTHHQEAQIGLKAAEAEDKLAEAKLARPSSTWLAQRPCGTSARSRRSSTIVPSLKIVCSPPKGS